MRVIKVKPGSTDVSIEVRIIDETTGQPETGVTAATSGLDLQTRRAKAAAVDLTEADLSAITDAHSDGGIKHGGYGNYRVDVPDEAVAIGADYCVVEGTVTGMIVIPVLLDLTEEGRSFAGILTDGALQSITLPSTADGTFARYLGHALRICHAGLTAAPALGIHTTPEQFKVGAFTSRFNGLPYSKNAATALTFSAAHVITANKFGIILVQIDPTTGTISTKVPSSTQAYDDAPTALAALPALDTGKIKVGHIAIANNAGDWTANTDDLTNGSDVTTAAFVDGALIGGVEEWSDIATYTPGTRIAILSRALQIAAAEGDEAYLFGAPLGSTAAEQTESIIAALSGQGGYEFDAETDPNTLAVTTPTTSYSATLTRNASVNPVTKVT